MLKQSTSNGYFLFQVVVVMEFHVDLGNCGIWTGIPGHVLVRGAKRAGLHCSIHAFCTDFWGRHRLHHPPWAGLPRKVSWCPVTHTHLLLSCDYITGFTCSLSWCWQCFGVTSGDCWPLLSFVGQEQGSPQLCSEGSRGEWREPSASTTAICVKEGIFLEDWRPPSSTYMFCNTCSLYACIRSKSLSCMLSSSFLG